MVNMYVYRIIRKKERKKNCLLVKNKKTCKSTHTNIFPGRIDVRQAACKITTQHVEKYVVPTPLSRIRVGK
jgi:hypothetical protein